MMHVGGYHASTSGRYIEYIGECSVHRGMFSASGFSLEIERFLPTFSPTCIMISPDVLNISRCTEHLPMYRTSPNVLMVSPMYSWYPPNVLNIPWCTHDISPNCTEHPPPPDVLMVSPDVLNTPVVLNTHNTGC